MTTRRPILHGRLDTGDTVDDPSEDAQCIRLEDGSYQVERRRGDVSTHETVQVADMRTAHERLTSRGFTL